MSFLSARKKHQEFDKVIRPHLDKLYRLAYRLSGSRDQAEDLVQETVIRIYPKQHELKALDKPGSWLAKVLYNLFVDWKRREQRSPVLVNSEVAEDEGAQVINLDFTPVRQNSLEFSVDKGQFTSRLLKALEKLSEEQRLALMLYEVEGYTLPEIEEITNVPVGTLKSRLFRARSQLKTLFNQGTDDTAQACQEVGDQ